MTVYSLQKFNFQDGLDEVGLRYSMPRLLDEDLVTYRKRLLAEVKDPSGSTQADYYRTGGRVLGQMGTRVFAISLIELGGSPVAPDARVEITSSMIRTWSDYGNNTLDIEAQLSEVKFLRDLEALFIGNAFFTISTVSSADEFKFCEQLRISDSDGLVAREFLRPSTCNKLRENNVSNIIFEDNAVFSRLRPGIGFLDQAGDYYVDLLNGVVFSYSIQSGYVTYEHRVFPFSIYWEPVRFWALNDQDKDRIIYDPTINDETGELIFNRLNSVGADLGNEIYLTHPLNWGE